MNYVCGFAFNYDKTEVALILKNRPAFLKGKLNGIGGKIEDIDRNAYAAMVREFKEEAGCDTLESEWNFMGNLFFTNHHHVGNQMVSFFYAKLSYDKFKQIRTMEDEEIIIYPVPVSQLWEYPMDPHAYIFLMGAIRNDVSSMDIVLK